MTNYFIISSELYPTRGQQSLPPNNKFAKCHDEFKIEEKDSTFFAKKMNQKRNKEKHHDVRLFLNMHKIFRSKR